MAQQNQINEDELFNSLMNYKETPQVSAPVEQPQAPRSNKFAVEDNTSSPLGFGERFGLQEYYDPASIVKFLKKKGYDVKKSKSGEFFVKQGDKYQNIDPSSMRDLPMDFLADFLPAAPSMAVDLGVTSATMPIIPALATAAGASTGPAGATGAGGLGAFLSLIGSGAAGSYAGETARQKIGEGLGTWDQPDEENQSQRKKAAIVGGLINAVLPMTGKVFTASSKQALGKAADALGLKALMTDNKVIQALIDMGEGKSKTLATSAKSPEQIEKLLKEAAKLGLLGKDRDEVLGKIGVETAQKVKKQIGGKKVPAASFKDMISDLLGKAKKDLQFASEPEKLAGTVDDLSKGSVDPIVNKVIKKTVKKADVEIPETVVEEAYKKYLKANHPNLAMDIIEKKIPFRKVSGKFASRDVKYAKTSPKQLPILSYEEFKNQFSNQGRNIVENIEDQSYLKAEDILELVQKLKAPSKLANAENEGVQELGKNVVRDAGKKALRGVAENADEFVGLTKLQKEVLIPLQIAFAKQGKKSAKQSGSFSILQDPVKKAENLLDVDTAKTSYYVGKILESLGKVDPNSSKKSLWTSQALRSAISKIMAAK